MYYTEMYKIFQTHNYHNYHIISLKIFILFKKLYLMGQSYNQKCQFKLN